jgi:hypothetical protein
VPGDVKIVELPFIHNGFLLQLVKAFPREVFLDWYAFDPA